ncbi:MAG: MFS transporter [Candidatus Limnocylindrales bacterium]
MTSSSSAPAPARVLLALPEFRALIGARALAAMGTSAIATVVAFQTWEVTGDPLSLGLLGLVQAIPALGLMLFGGHIADRRDRRSIILVTGSLLTAGTLVLALMSTTGAGASFAGILAVVFAIGVAAGFERPALVAFETQVIPIEHATRGASLSGGAWTAAAIVGPAAGGLAIAFLGIPATYLAIAVVMGLSVFFISRISPKPMPRTEQKEPVLTSLAGGVRYVARSQVLLSAMALDLFAVFFGGAMAMLPIFATDILAAGPVGLGALRTMPSAGALVAMLAAGRWQPRANAGRILLVCVALFGVAMIVFGLSTSFWLSMLALFGAGLVDGVSMVIRLIILRVESPEALRGRIASVNHVFIGASNELGAFESGVAASILGVVPSVVFGGIVTLVVVSGVTALAPQLRRLDLGRRLVEGPGAQPMATAAADASNIAATGVDPALEPVVKSVDRELEATERL